MVASNEKRLPASSGTKLQPWCSAVPPCLAHDNRPSHHRRPPLPGRRLTSCPANGGAPERTTLADSYQLFAISLVSSGANFGGLPPSGAFSPQPRFPGGLPPPTPLRHSFSQKVVFDCLVQIIALKPDSDKCPFARPASPDAFHLPQEPIRSQIEMHPDWLGHPLIRCISVAV